LLAARPTTACPFQPPTAFSLSGILLQKRHYFD
jgi:hypothetical protein